MIRPTQDWCVVREIPQSPSEAILVTDTHGLRDQYLKAEVISVGPGYHKGKKLKDTNGRGAFQRTTLKPGDIILFNRKHRELGWSLKTRKGNEPNIWGVRERYVELVLD